MGTLAYPPASAGAARERYGHFSEDGREYIITRHDTPRPWVNVLCNQEPGYGVIISQSGSGYSWLHNAELNRITRWDQDLIQDNRGRYLYLRDRVSGEVWSAGFQPVRRVPDEYECRYGPGYATITSLNSGIRTRFTCWVPPGKPLEVWTLEVENAGREPRSLSVTSYLEWALGTAHDTHREFHKTFIETQALPDEGLLLARKRLWGIGNSKGQGWNRSWDGVAFHAVSSPVAGFEGDREAFIGMGRTLQDPAAMERGTLTGSQGKWGDGMASFMVDVDLAPGEAERIVFTVGVGEDEGDARTLAGELRSVEAADRSLEETRQWWDDRLSDFQVETPDDDLNALMNTWLRYQTMAGRVWGRTGYYQPGGAYGFRDQLQDGQVFLPTEPEHTKKQILLQARHQLVEGNVLHWWQPITEQGPPSRFSDDLLWLPFVVLNYLDETADRAVLEEGAPYLNSGEEPLSAHCFRALDLSLSRFSDRGLPLLGEGDWNDGLSAAGWDGKGESVWVGHFLCYLLPRWAEVAERLGDAERAREYRRRAEDLKAAVNREGWDGEWYYRATTDDGSLIGSRECSEGQIFLNAQTWSVISGTCPSERREALMQVARARLYTKSGPALLRPAYTKPDERIGYLTRYAPGARENGGTYLHAATWAIWAECLLGNAEQAWRIYKGISPAVQGEDADRYKTEPYATAGNIDGPDSPNQGRGGWSWYTGSAGWLFKVMAERVLGVRPEAEGLRIDPCLPEHWEAFRMRRLFRGAVYDIRVKRGREASVTVDGRHVEGGVLPVAAPGTECWVEVHVL